MKKILLTSLAALFAISTAQAALLPAGGVVGSSTFNTKIGDEQTLITTSKVVVPAINELATAISGLTPNVYEADETTLTLDTTDNIFSVAAGGITNTQINSGLKDTAITSSSDNNHLATGKAVFDTLGSAGAKGTLTEDAVTTGDMRAVTSNAVAAAISGIPGNTEYNAGEAVDFVTETDDSVTINTLYDNSTIGLDASNQLKVKDGGITNTQIASGLKDTAISSSSDHNHLATGKAVYDYVDSVVPQYPPQECIDAQSGQLTCILGQEWDPVGSALVWKWLPLL